jgi:hypothetical protein
VPTPGLARTSDGVLATVMTEPRNGHQAELVMLRSTDSGRHWQRTLLAGPIPINGSTGEATGLGLYQETVGAKAKLAAGLVIPGRLATSGPTDVFLAHVHG